MGLENIVELYTAIKLTDTNEYLKKGWILFSAPIVISKKLISNEEKIETDYFLGWPKKLKTQKIRIGYGIPE